MELTHALLIYALLVIVLIIILYRYGYYLGPAVIISLITGQILLNIMTPLSDLDPDTTNASLYALYMLAQLATPVVVYIYAFVVAVKDYPRKVG